MNIRTILMAGFAVVSMCGSVSVMAAEETVQSDSKEIPYVDVFNRCSKINSGYPITMKSCVDIEQSSYNQVKEIWSNIPSDVQNNCIESTFSYLGIYDSFADPKPTPLGVGYGGVYTPNLNIDISHLFSV